MTVLLYISYPICQQSLWLYYHNTYRLWPLPTASIVITTVQATTIISHLDYYFSFLTIVSALSLLPHELCSTQLKRSNHLKIPDCATHLLKILQWLSISKSQSFQSSTKLPSSVTSCYPLPLHFCSSHTTISQIRGPTYLCSFSQVFAMA